MIKRLKFRCWNCLREYAMTREIDGQPQLVVACPFCDKEAVVDLNPYRSPTTVVYRGDDTPAAQAAPTYNFPDVIPTAAPGDATATQAPLKPSELGA